MSYNNCHICKQVVSKRVFHVFFNVVFSFFKCTIYDYDCNLKNLALSCSHFILYNKNHDFIDVFVFDFFFKLPYSGIGIRVIPDTNIHVPMQHIFPHFLGKIIAN